jgi:CheY-like chemotaxis protein
MPPRRDSRARRDGELAIPPAKRMEMQMKFAHLLMRAIAFLAFFSCIEAAAEETATQSKPISDVESPTAAITREYINVLEKLGNRFEEVIKSDQDAAQSEAKAIDAHLQTFLWIVGVVGTILFAGAALLAFLSARWIEHWIEREAMQQVQSRLGAAIDAQVAKEVRGSVEVKRLADEVDKLQTDMAQVSASQKLPDMDANARSQFFGKRIVWVDDQPATTQAARDELERNGIRTDAAVSTEQLETLLSSNANFHLIVSDMRREGSPRAGLDYFQRIKDDQSLPPRLLFAKRSSIARFKEEIENLQASSPKKFLRPATSSKEFFAAVFNELGKTS